VLNDAECTLTDKITATQDFVQPFRGSLEMIIGPMFAGKSTELLRRVDRHRHSGKRCLYIKYSGDVRYDSKSVIATHDLVKQDAVSVQKFADIGDSWKNYDCIGIDEGQFYIDVVDFAENAALAGKIVIISALSGSAFR